MSELRCIVLGGGGHAGVVIDALTSIGSVTCAGILDADPTRSGTSVFGAPVLGNDSLLAGLADEAAVTHFVVGVGSIGDASLRSTLFNDALQHGLTPYTLVHPAAHCSENAKMGEGSMAFAGCVINPGTIMGKNVILNTRSLVEHDCRLGNHVHLAPGAILCGHVTIGDGAHVGAGAVVKEGVTIGAGAMVGAGAVVLKDVTDGQTVVGCPARSL